MTLIHRLLVRHLIVSTIAVAIVVYAPILLIAVLAQVPRPVLYSDFIWPVVAGIAPVAAFIVLPIVVGIAATVTYGLMLSDFSIPAFYAARLSTAAIVAPALVLALVATALGWVLANVVAPVTTKRVHDVLHVVRHNLDPHLLEAGRIYSLDGGRQTFFFSRWSGPEMEDLFLRETTPTEERVTTARVASFVRHGDQFLAVLRAGSVQIFRPKTEDVEIVHFEVLARPTVFGGDFGAPRDWIGVFEMSTGALVRRLIEGTPGREPMSSVVSELLKRLVLPVTAVTHVLFGLGFAMHQGSEVRLGLRWVVVWGAAIVGIGAGLLFLAEAAIHLHPSMVLLFVGAILAQAWFSLSMMGLRFGRRRVGPPAPGLR